MRRLRWLAWFANVLLMVTLVASGAHSHHSGPLAQDTCIACTLAHAPIAPTTIAPAPTAPEPTHEVAIEMPLLVVVPPLCAVPSSRGPPLA
jgi:hypothetical protein